MNMLADIIIVTKKMMWKDQVEIWAGILATREREEC
jgi:hypothetical protein